MRAEALMEGCKTVLCATSDDYEDEDNVEEEKKIKKR